MAALRPRSILKPASLWIAYLCGAPLSSSSALWRATFKGGASLKAPSNVLSYPPNDPLFPHQKTFFEALRIKEVWEAVTESGLSRKDVFVTIIDTGIAPGHPEFEGKLLEGYDASGAWPESLTDHSGHGTAMAGVLGANINNGVGIAGIADRVKMRVIRMTHHVNGAGYAQATRSWEAALTLDDTDVIVFANVMPFEHNLSLFFKRILKKAVRKGILVLVSTTNSDNVDGPEENVLPCSLANSISGVLCIAGTRAKEELVLSTGAAKLASFGVPSTRVVHPSPTRNGSEWEYFRNWGSSAATAAVGGLVALMKSFKNFKPREIERILLNSTKERCRTNSGEEMLYGVLRPELAIRQAIAVAR
ncbi:hypothetical protein FOZ63_004327 [Perkinsus olseni]|uniref:subtilisin n=1 Tax=Perkinsus olseni TaxID=32597 RepID=A0A7J6S2P8_PEROL|nr:hypothetical protein FOZ63_004327 [Perkinsus olseni]